MIELETLTRQIWKESDDALLKEIESHSDAQREMYKGHTSDIISIKDPSGRLIDVYRVDAIDALNQHVFEQLKCQRRIAAVTAFKQKIEDYEAQNLTQTQNQKA
ncbi:MAG: hypothetical protein WCI45_12535 [Desulfuromonadales bacterium]